MSNTDYEVRDQLREVVKRLDRIIELLENRDYVLTTEENNQIAVNVSNALRKKKLSRDVTYD